MWMSKFSIADKRWKNGWLSWNRTNTYHHCLWSFQVLCLLYQSVQLPLNSLFYLARTIVMRTNMLLVISLNKFCWHQVWLILFRYSAIYLRPIPTLFSFHHDHQIQELDDSSPLTQHEIWIANLYHNADEVIKAIFNMNINPEILQSMDQFGVNIARNVEAGLIRYLSQWAVREILENVLFRANVGVRWRNILSKSRGVTTIAIQILLAKEFNTPLNV